MWAAWLRRPMVVSRVLELTLLYFNICLISYIQSFAFRRGKDMRNKRVLMSQPRTHLISSGVPSPSSLGILVALARGSGSDSLVGRKTVWTASGAACCPFVTQSA